MATTGKQSRNEGESYADYMARLYRSPRYELKARGSNGAFIPGAAGEKRPMWSFRPPLVLASAAYIFMKKHGMSITTYLTYAMHKLHSDSNG